MLDTSETQSVLKSKLKVLEKYKKDIMDRIKFCDISQLLISSNVISKDDCFEICSLPLKKQIKLLYDKFLTILEEENATEDKEKDTWDILLRSLKSEHPLLSCKMDSELQKLVKTDKPRKITKDDIGTPLHFKHLQHIPDKPRRFRSLRSTASISSTKSSVDENDPDVKAFLSIVGVTNDHLKRPVTRRVILDFIDRNGGIEAIRREIRPIEGYKPGSLHEKSNSTLLFNFK